MKFYDPNLAMLKKHEYLSKKKAPLVLEDDLNGPIANITKIMKSTHLEDSCSLDQDNENNKIIRKRQKTELSGPKNILAKFFKK